ncbi:MAG: site-specific integrase [Sulfurovaceae bacterium]|nr:site-specific integrase [Sulfurovaceae bacterium]
MTPTRYEGVYYQINRNGKKTYIARYKINGKSHKKVLGMEPEINALTAHRLRYEIIEGHKGGGDYTIDEYFERYCAAREATLSHSWYYNIRKNYRKHLQSFIGKKYPHQVSSDEIQKIMNDMLGTGYKPSTVKQIKDCVSGLYAYLIRNGVETENIGKVLELPKFDNKIYFTTTIDEAKRLYEIITTYHDIKWRTYFTFLLHGRRKSEVMLMRWEYINWELMSYRVPADNVKTVKEINAPMLPILAECLRLLGVKDSGWIFDGGADGHISLTGIDFQWRNIKMLANLPKMRLHDLRHFIGFWAINQGATLEQIGYVLGHQSINTTKRYSNLKLDTASKVLGDVFKSLS